MNDERELLITRLVDAAPERLFAAWTTPDLFARWFAPTPWTVAKAQLDPRPGGDCTVVMRSPDGTEVSCPGVFLEVTPGRRVVTTDAYAGDWVPSAKAFMTVVATFEPEGGKTRYTVRARHWTTADRVAHEKMGFHHGWAQCADQLVALVGAS
jgi:uncharacterized protein YndB with AHSA1/START domain